VYQYLLNDHHIFRYDISVEFEICLTFPNSCCFSVIFAIPAQHGEKYEAYDVTQAGATAVLFLAQRRGRILRNDERGGERQVSVRESGCLLRTRLLSYQHDG
jgi:hypothetical protein